MTGAVDAKPLWMLFSLTVLLLLARMTEPTTIMAFVVLAGACFLGPQALILSLAGSWLLVLANPGIFPDVPIAAMLRYLVYFGAAASLVLGRRGQVIAQSGKAPIVFALLVSMLIGFHSLSISPFFSISAMKILSWCVVFVSLLVAWFRMSPEKGAQTREYLFASGVILLALSLPLQFASFGYFRNGTGFQGLLNHPQPFGLFAGMVAVWSALRALRGEPRSALNAIVALFSAEMLLASETRTALLSVAIALGLSILPAVLFAPHWLSASGGRPHRAALTAAVIIPTALFVLLLPATQDFLGAFLSKSGRVTGVEGISALYERSRGGLIQPMLANISNYPWTGIGFGLPSDLFSLEAKYDPYFGLPLSASIEKGNMFLAVIEELGWPLAIAVFAMLLMFVNRARAGGVVPLALCFYCLAINLGENILFSPGGMGMMVLIILSCSVSWAMQRK